MRRVYFVLIYLLLVYLLFELVLRLFFAFQHNNIEILTDPTVILHEHYPMLKEKEQSHEISEQAIRILFLGGSVIDDRWSSIEKILKEELEKQIGQKVYIRNLSSHSHTSLDSKYKYELISQPFDIILFYHGINEVRFNNCPKEFFKTDYTHVQFYREIDPAVGQRMKYTLIPYAIEVIEMVIRSQLDKTPLLPIIFLEEFEWLKYGNEIKTDETFKRNIEEIIELAESREAQVIIPTFAWYSPDNYSLEAFKSKSLDYEEHLTPIEIWGEKDNVIKGLEAHNSVIRSLKKKDNFMVVEMDSMISKNGRNFKDICHLTDIGSKEFVSIIMPYFEKAVEEFNNPSFTRVCPSAEASAARGRRARNIEY